MGRILLDQQGATPLLLRGRAWGAAGPPAFRRRLDGIDRAVANWGTDADRARFRRARRLVRVALVASLAGAWSQLLRPRALRDAVLRRAPATADVPNGRP